MATRREQLDKACGADADSIEGKCRELDINVEASHASPLPMLHVHTACFVLRRRTSLGVPEPRQMQPWQPHWPSWHCWLWCVYQL